MIVIKLKWILILLFFEATKPILILYNGFIFLFFEQGQKTL